MADYQVSVVYDGKKIIPAPFISFTKVIRRTPDGIVRFRGWKIVVKGKVCAFKGSPDNSGTFHTGSGYPADPNPTDNEPVDRIPNLRNKLGALTKLLSVDGRWFEIMPGDGSAPIKFQPRIDELQYAEGKWFDTVDWSVQMEAETVAFGTFVEQPFDDSLAEETWSCEQADEYGRTFKVSHAINATRPLLFANDGTVDTLAWERAKASVLAAVGYDETKAKSDGNPKTTSKSNYNYTRSFQSDEPNGKYAVNETWLLADHPYIEEQSVDSKYSADTGRYIVTVQGSINGFESNPDSSTSRYDNANTRLADITDDFKYTLATTLSGVPLHPLPLNKTVVKNKVTGIISYTTEFDDRPALSDDAFLSETLDISIDKAVPVVAQIGVLLRPAGPVLQEIGSSTQKSITVTAEVVLKTTYGQPLPAKPNYDTLSPALSEIGSYQVYYVTSDRENWSRRRGRYSRTTSLIWQ